MVAALTSFISAFCGDKRGIDKALKNRGIDEALAIPQSELRQPRSYDAAGKILPFVTTYTQNNPSVFSTIKTTFEALASARYFHSCK